MADEIMVLTRVPMARNREQIDVLFFYRINPVIEVNSQVVIPTPSASLPPEVNLYSLLTAAELAALDDGSAMYEQRTFVRKPWETQNQVLLRVRQAYATRAPARIQAERDKYASLGVRVDA